MKFCHMTLCALVRQKPEILLTPLAVLIFRFSFCLIFLIAVQIQVNALERSHDVQASSETMYFVDLYYGTLLKFFPISQ